MNDCGKTARRLPEPRPDQLLAQRSLACELTGELERAVALIRCLQDLALGPADGLDRRIERAEET